VKSKPTKTAAATDRPRPLGLLGPR
jgi:hypothetical protein